MEDYHAYDHYKRRNNLNEEIDGKSDEKRVENVHIFSTNSTYGSKNSTF